MFRVKDGRDKRKKNVVRLAVQEPFVGVLAAAADFEWTCRRAILAMGKGPTTEIKFELFEQKAFGLKLNKGWEKQVKQKSKGVLRFEDIFSLWAKENCPAYVIWPDIEYAMMWRNRLVHGIENDIGEADGRKCVNILECACDILVQYLSFLNGDIYSYIGRRGKLNAAAESVRKNRKRLALENREARRPAKDERVICGVRFLRKTIQSELGISAKKFEFASQQISRRFGIRLLV